MAVALPALGAIGTAIVGSTASAATASSLAAASIGASAVGAGFTAAGSVAGGISQYQQANYQSHVAKNNAAIALQGAQDSLLAGDQAGEQSKLKTGATIAAQTTAEAANGIEVDSGTPQAIKASTQGLGDLDAETVRYNSLKQAYGYDFQAANDIAESKMDRRAGRGALAAGIVGAGASLIGGASSITGKMAAFKQSGALA